jgi:hypothetical protein
LGPIGIANAAKNVNRGNARFGKDADPDIPILKQAKAEYARLEAVH